MDTVTQDNCSVYILYINVATEASKRESGDGAAAPEEPGLLSYGP